MKKFFAEFKEFAVKGNMMDLAVGMIIGAAFTSIVTALVNNIINPIIGIFTGKVDFAELFVSLDGTHYATLADAEAAGASVLKYGAFISAIINFIIVALVVFMMVKVMNGARKKAEAKKKAAEEPAAPTTQVCPFCKSEINIEATRCPHCTSQLEVKKVPVEPALGE